MKRPNIYLPMAALILAALAIPAAAQQEVPFKGTFQGSDRVPCPPASICTTATGTGTHLGDFSFKQEVTVAANLTDKGSAHWIAANGDSIDTTAVASAKPVDMAPCQVPGAEPGDTYAKITQIHTITAGTGRFAGVQGSFTLTLYHDVRLSSDGTHHTCGSYSGTITPPGVAR